MFVFRFALLLLLCFVDCFLFVCLFVLSTISEVSELQTGPEQKMCRFSSADKLTISWRPQTEL